MILDTNAVSALLAGEPGLQRLLEGELRHHLPIVVVGEYRFGLARSKQRKSLERLFDTLIEESLVLIADLDTARHYAEVREELRRRGTPIPENDVWIAALARQHGLPLASRDRHFDEVARLERREW